MEEYISRGLKIEILKVMLLTSLSRSGGYPYGLLKGIQHKHIWLVKGLTKSDLYNTLNALEREGYIKSSISTKGAIAHKNYILTPKGKRIVRASKKTMISSFKGIIEMMRNEK